MAQTGFPERLYRLRSLKGSSVLRQVAYHSGSHKHHSEIGHSQEGSYFVKLYYIPVKRTRTVVQMSTTGEQTNTVPITVSLTQPQKEGNPGTCTRDPEDTVPSDRSQTPRADPKWPATRVVRRRVLDGTVGVRGLTAGGHTFSPTYKKQGNCGNMEER